LHSEQIAAIARAIHGREDLRERFEVKLPEQQLRGQNLPPEYLTSERATYYRHAACDKAALLVANMGDDEEQSLRELLPVGSRQLREHPKLWVASASKGMLLGEQEKWWSQALSALSYLGIGSLQELATYTLRVQRHIKEDGQPLLSSLGMALPALKMPKNTAVFQGIAKKKRGWKSEWDRKLKRIWNFEAPFLRKQDQSGKTLTTRALKARFEEVKEEIPEACHPTIEAFIEAPEGWNLEAEALADEEWIEIKPLFERLQKTKKYDFKVKTVDFYSQLDPELLDDEERDYLKRLVGSKRTAADEEDAAFFDNHRQELAADPKLYSAWEKFVYRSPIQTDNLLQGLALALESLVAENPGERGTITIRSDRQTRKDYQSLNKRAGQYFAFRYKGLDRVLVPHVIWEVGDLFRYPVLELEWQEKGFRYGMSRSRAARQIKFDIRISRGESVQKKRLIWNFNREQISSQLPSDWDRLRKNPLVACKVASEPVRPRGEEARLDLHDRSTLVAMYGGQRGTLIAAHGNDAAVDLGQKWKSNLDKAVCGSLLGVEAKETLEGLFGAFLEAYTEAVRGFGEQGVGHGALEHQSEAFGELLRSVCQAAQNDRAKSLLLKPLVSIGVAQDENDAQDLVAIVAPWQPLRLAAMARKATRVRNLVETICSGEDVRFGDRKLFIQDLGEVLADPFYPEVVPGWCGSSAKVLSLIDFADGYTLHGLPGDDKAGLEANPRESAEQVMDLVKRFLNLYPHEKADLSVALFNPEAASLPLAVARKLHEQLKDEVDLRCHLILLNNNYRRLTRLYQGLIESVEHDGYLPTDGDREFMSWLQIQTLPKIPTGMYDERPVDILFAQDAISCHASFEWHAQEIALASPERLVPRHWSRRYPSRLGMERSAVYLCCPEQTREGWSYLRTLHALTTRKDQLWKEESEGLLPVLQVSFGDSQTKAVIDESHRVANWVANYDALLDRAHLRSQGIKIMRWKEAVARGRSLIVSSKAETNLLKRMVVERLQQLGMPLEKKNLERLADSMLQDANEISGDIALRAAKRGRNASELIGVVLSRFLIQCGLKGGRDAGWYFLDDYVAWLGQREGQVADILALSPWRNGDDAWEMDVVVSEAKYVKEPGYTAKVKTSKRQLLRTMRKLHDALDESAPRLDRDLWLSRFADLLLDRIIATVGGVGESADLRRAIREGRCKTQLRGYSHVFVYGPSGAHLLGGEEPLGSMENAFQDIRGPGQVRSLVIEYAETKGIQAETADGDGADNNDDEAETKTNGEDTGGEIPGGTNVIVVKPDPDPDDPKFNIKGAAVVFERLTKVMVPVQPESDSAKEWLADVERQLKAALRQFNLTSKMKQSRLTPNTALLDFQGTADLTVAKVERRQSELLTTYGLSVISVLPRPGIVSISIARQERETVHMQNLWANWKPSMQDGNDELLIGVREDNGLFQVLNPGGSHAPHTLIAGSTGSGKSVLMQNMLLSIAATNTPEQARITLIDPKQGVDYFAFEALPHLDGGVITSQDKALAHIDGLVHEMDRRYGLLRRQRAESLRKYNKKVSPKDRLPVLWVFHDEFAEWMLTDSYKTNVTNAVARLGVKARAAGIYLVFASQRPEAKVMPMQLRDNLGNRLVLRVNSSGSSDIALGEKGQGAERLLGRGHLLARLDGEPSLIYLQVPYVEPETISCAVKTISKYYCDEQSPRVVESK